MRLFRSQPAPSSSAGVFSHPLVRELTLVLLLKLAAIVAIKTLWFSEPVDMQQPEVRVSEQLGLKPRIAAPAVSQPEVEYPHD